MTLILDFRQVDRRSNLYNANTIMLHCRRVPTAFACFAYCHMKMRAQREPKYNANFSSTLYKIHINGPICTRLYPTHGAVWTSPGSSSYTVELWPLRKTCTRPYYAFEIARSNELYGWMLYALIKKIWMSRAIRCNLWRGYTVKQPVY